LKPGSKGEYLGPNMMRMGSGESCTLRNFIVNVMIVYSEKISKNKMVRACSQNGRSQISNWEIVE
jgi:hypothetical protein